MSAPTYATVGDVGDVTSSSSYTHAGRDTYRKRVTYVTHKPKRVADQDFHLWPDLAFKCQVCGWPVDKVTYPVHPGCEGAS